MNSTDRPWMTALEKQFSLLANSRRGVALNDGLASARDAAIVRLLPGATTFAWMGETASAVWIASQSIPSNSMLNLSDLPDAHTSSFWWLECPLPIPMDKEPHDKIQDDVFDAYTIPGLALEVTRDRSELRAFIVRDSEHGPLSSGFVSFPFGMSLADFTEKRVVNVAPAFGWNPGSNGELIFRFILAAMVWLRQRVVISSEGLIERHRRKQLARDLDVPLPSDVKVIQFRRSESQPNFGGEHEAVDWSCRWVVGGHWRNQPYKDERKLIYILPYVKGPADKPLKVPTHTVYMVNR